MKKPILSSAIKGIIGLAFVSAAFRQDTPLGVFIGLAIGAGLLWWAARPFIRKNKTAPAAEPARTEGPKAPQQVSYPFASYGMARAATVRDYIVFDTETTGFSPQDDKIIELAAVKIRGGKVTRFHSLINPGRRIPQKSRDVHGISDADVAKAPTFAKILPALDAFLDPDLPIVGHNVLFDLRMLWWEYHDAGRSLSSRLYINTYDMAKKAFPGRSSYALASLIHDYGLILGEQTHRSESDVDATLALFRLCCDRLS